MRKPNSKLATLPLATCSPLFTPGQSGIRYLVLFLQIRSPHDKRISECIQNNLEPWESSWDTELVKTSPHRTDLLDEISKLYYEDLQQLCHSRFVNAPSAQ